MDPLIGREDILERTIQVLCRRFKNNPVHVGEPGVGKTAITEGLAQLIAKDQVPKKLLGARIYSLDMGAVLAGTRSRGDFEERLKRIITDLQKLEKAILFIDEIHNVIGAGAREIGRQTIGFEGQPINRDAVFKAVEKTFSPEFRNRLDSVVNFHSLEEAVVLKIVKKAIAEFAAQLTDKRVLFTVTDRCCDWLARRGYSTEFGAREIARLIQDKIKHFFVDEVLFGNLREGGEAVADEHIDVHLLNFLTTFV